MKNVWIVDDDRSIRWVLEKALQKADIPCKTFSEAESVLQAIKKEQPRSEEHTSELQSR